MGPRAGTSPVDRGRWHRAGGMGDSARGRPSSLTHLLLLCSPTPPLQHPARGYPVERRGHQPQHLVITPAQAWPPREMTTAWAPTPPGHPFQATGDLPQTTSLPLLRSLPRLPLSLSSCVHPGLLSSQACPFTSCPGTLAPPCNQSCLLHQPGHLSLLRPGSLAASLVCTAHG